jgi:hypothetical protein
MPPPFLNVELGVNGYVEEEVSRRLMNHLHI